MMEITREWLTEKRACPSVLEWFVAEGIIEPIEGIRNLVAKGHWDWANWLIVRVMTKPQYLAYAIFAAEQVIDIFEMKYPNDKRPRNAIESAKAVLANDTEQNRLNAAAAAAAATTATYAASSASSATAATATAATAASYAAYDCAAGARLRAEIIEYGISLLERGE